MVADGELLEWALVHQSARYGTPRRPVERALAEGRPAMLEIDLQGARQVRETMPEALFVFLKPPSWDELVRRLVGRGTESARNGPSASTPRGSSWPPRRSSTSPSSTTKFTLRPTSWWLMTLDLEHPPSTTCEVTRLRPTSPPRGCHQPLDRRPAHQDRQQVQAGPLQRQARASDQRLLPQLGEGLLEYVGPLVDTHVQEKPLDRAARDQRGPADLRGSSTPPSSPPRRPPPRQPRSTRRSTPASDPPDRRGPMTSNTHEAASQSGARAPFSACPAASRRTRPASCSAGSPSPATT